VADTPRPVAEGLSGGVIGDKIVLLRGVDLHVHQVSSGRLTCVLCGTGCAEQSAADQLLASTESEAAMEAVFEAECDSKGGRGVAIKEQHVWSYRRRSLDAVCPLLPSLLVPSDGAVVVDTTAPSVSFAGLPHAVNFHSSLSFPFCIRCANARTGLLARAASCATARRHGCQRASCLSTLPRSTRCTGRVYFNTRVSSVTHAALNSGMTAVNTACS
jgi:hypothetical protein